ncbi:MAG: hypothetical protein WCJ01_00560 [Ignavibacteria bacterium]
MKILKRIMFLALLAGFGNFYGCYTQLSTRGYRAERDYDKNRGYETNDRYSDDQTGQDTAGYADNNQSYQGGSAYDNYDDGYYYRPFYRRYYGGYQPGLTTGIGFGYYNPYWYDNYCSFDPFYSADFYPFYNHYYGYNYWGGGYYGSHNYGYSGGYGGKHHANDITRLRNNDGGRGAYTSRRRDLLTSPRGGSIANPLISGSGGTTRQRHDVVTQRGNAVSRRAVEQKSRQRDASSENRNYKPDSGANSNNRNERQSEVRRRQQPRVIYEKPGNGQNRDAGDQRHSRMDNRERRNVNYNPAQQPGRNPAPVYERPSAEQRSSTPAPQSRNSRNDDAGRSSSNDNNKRSR